MVRLVGGERRWMPVMRRGVLLCGSLLWAAIVGACGSFGGSDVVPGDASVVDPDSGAGQGSADGSAMADATDDGGSADASVSVAQTYFTKTVYPSIRPTCESCHIAPPAVAKDAWFKGTAAATYKEVKARKYDQAPAATNPIIAKGVHDGPALDGGTQVPLVTEWISLENDGGT